MPNRGGSALTIYLRLWPFAQGHIEVEGLAVAIDAEFQLLAGLELEQGVDERVVLINLRAANAGDDVADFQTCLSRRAVTGQVGDVDAPLHIETVLLCEVGRNLLPLNAEVGAGDMALLNNLLANCLHRIRPNRKAQSFSLIGG